MRWVVSISREDGLPTLADQDAAAQQQLVDNAETLPLVQTVKAAFPGASIRKVTPREAALDEFDDPDMILDPDMEPADADDMDDR